MGKVYKYKTLNRLVNRLRDDLRTKDFVLLFAYNGTGKTRLSMAFKDKGKQGESRDTLYFNAYTEDLFHWDNDLKNDSNRFLLIKSQSNFFNGFKELALESRIASYFQRYTDLDFDIDYNEWKVSFSKRMKNPKYHPKNNEPEYITRENIKVSRGEENIFIWSVFLAICELVIDGDEAYDWVKYIYIDDPISSLDDNNAITIASDLAKLMKKAKDRIKIVVSSHHSLFFNVMSNELKKYAHTNYFLHRNRNDIFILQKTNETPFFHHVAILSELKELSKTGNLNTYHFNSLRSILEKTATFFGYEDFGKCLDGMKDEVLYTRALNLLSHGKYSVFAPKEMNEDNKKLFSDILNAFLDKYKFELPELLKENQ